MKMTELLSLKVYTFTFYKLFYFRFPVIVISAASGQTVVSIKVSQSSR